MEKTKTKAQPIVDRNRSTAADRLASLAVNYPVAIAEEPLQTRVMLNALPHKDRPTLILGLSIRGEERQFAIDLSAERVREIYPFPEDEFKDTKISHDKIEYQRDKALRYIWSLLHRLDTINDDAMILSFDEKGRGFDHHYFEHRSDLLAYLSDHARHTYSQGVSIVRLNQYISMLLGLHPRAARLHKELGWELPKLGNDHDKLA